MSLKSFESKRYKMQEVNYFHISCVKSILRENGENIYKEKFFLKHYIFI